MLAKCFLFAYQNIQGLIQKHAKCGFFISKKENYERYDENKFRKCVFNGFAVTIRVSFVLWQNQLYQRLLDMFQFKKLFYSDIRWCVCECYWPGNGNNLEQDQRRGKQLHVCKNGYWCAQNSDMTFLIYWRSLIIGALSETKYLRKCRYIKS